MGMMCLLHYAYVLLLLVHAYIVVAQPSDWWSGMLCKDLCLVVGNTYTCIVSIIDRDQQYQLAHVRALGTCYRSTR